MFKFGCADAPDCHHVICPEVVAYGDTLSGDAEAVIRITRDIDGKWGFTIEVSLVGDAKNGGEARRKADRIARDILDLWRAKTPQKAAVSR
jgi:hypothetical protein